METEDLPQNLQEIVDNAHFNSSTIECDIQDAIAAAENEDDLRERIIDAMDNIIGEASGIREKAMYRPPKVCPECDESYNWEDNGHDWDAIKKFGKCTECLDGCPYCNEEE